MVKGPEMGGEDSGNLGVRFDVSKPFDLSTGSRPRKLMDQAQDVADSTN